MLNKEETEKLFREIYATGGETDEMAELVKKLKDELDEREGEQKELGEAVPDGYESWGAVVAEKDAALAEAKDRYYNRFMQGEPEEPKQEDDKESLDAEKDESAPRTFDSLFKKKEK